MDAERVFARAGLSLAELEKPGARYPFSAMQRLWHEARTATGDPCIGLAAAKRLKPQALHALGLSWIASGSLYEAFQRMMRYSRIASSGLKVIVSEQDGRVKVSPELDDPTLQPEPEAVDATLGFCVTLCRFIADAHFAPLEVVFQRPDNGHADQYVDFFRSPVFFSRPINALYFDAAAVHEPVPAGNEELAREADQITDRYLATLEPGNVQDKVKEILLTLLPSGETDQRAVAQSLNRSVSALQRQLRAEGSSYRQVLDETRQTMAIRFVEEQRYSLGQIAYLLGFSDQANFSRAFKRWTGTPPSDYARRA
ncbi:MAG: AraC family transcriptional regulator [Gammaproteobacteria bacterium]